MTARLEQKVAAVDRQTLQRISSSLTIGKVPIL
jgi:hypothetical protein